MMITINPTQSPQGWECPKCGNVYAPWIWACQDCNNQFSTTTTICDHMWDTHNTAPRCLKCGESYPFTPSWSWTITTEDSGNICSQKNGSFESSQTPGPTTWVRALECMDVNEPIVITRFLDGTFS